MTSESDSRNIREDHSDYGHNAWLPTLAHHRTLPHEGLGRTDPLRNIPDPFIHRLRGENCGPGKRHFPLLLTNQQVFETWRIYGLTCIYK